MSDKFNCVEYIEKDEYAVDSYNAVFNTNHEPNDITQLDPGQLPDFNLFCGGFPCQAFSIAGEREGFEDTRGTLFFEIARIAEAKKPEVLFLENVKGLLSHDEGETFKVILQTLDELGYDAQWQVLNSKYHGVPQNRERVFIIAHRRELPRPEVFPITEPDQGTDSTGEESRLGVRNQKGELQTSDYSTAVDANYFKGLDNHGARTGIIDTTYGFDDIRTYSDESPAVRSERYGLKLVRWQNSRQGVVEDSEAPSLRSSQGGGIRKNPMILQIPRGDNTGGEHELSPTISADSWHNNNFLKQWKSGLLHSRGFEYKDHSDYSHAVKGGGGGSSKNFVTDEVRIRKLTLRECWRLQGFPDQAFEKAQEVNSDTQLYKQAGNAVTVNVVETIAEKLLNYFENLDSGVKRTKTDS